MYTSSVPGTRAIAATACGDVAINGRRAVAAVACCSSDADAGPGADTYLAVLVR